MSITDKSELQQRLWAALSNPKLYKPIGCDICDGTGYKWRIGIYEALEITPGVKDMILSGQSAFNINRQAIKDWMISLEQDWIIKAIKWYTSLEEVYRVAKTQNG
jgi:type II secretory ATPase GspE/PulE/Tfp pilus assembly ATPase PilB-like protein